MKTKAPTTNYYSLLVLVLIIFIISLNRLTEPPKNNLSWDTFGYYLILPATFIYHDPGISNKEVFDQLIDRYKSTSTFYQVALGPKGYHLMKYSLGMAVLYAPGFFTGHIVALSTDYPADGFSKPYQRAILFYNILFTLVGLIFLRKVLLRFFPDKIVAIVLVLIFFGTNYYSYATYNAEMPHNYLFTLYSLVLWLTLRWHESFRLKYLLFLVVCIGLATLARPTELIALIIPVFWGVTGVKSFKDKMVQTWKNHKSQIILSFFVLLCIGAIQVTYWYLYSGSLIYYGYKNPGEGFEFLWPYTLKFLFSFRKGWLIYTPLMVFSLWGIYLLWKKKSPIFLSVFLFFFVNLYVVSSWSCWWYAQSMGQRAMVQSYAVMSLPLGYALMAISKQKLWKRSLNAVVIILLVVLNLFQTWQIRHNIISKDRMTFAYYLNTFGSLEYKPEYEKLLLINRFNDGAGGIPEYRDYKAKLLKAMDFDESDEGFAKHISNSYSRSGKYSLKMDNSIVYGPYYSIPFKEITNDSYAWIRTSVWVYPVEDSINTKVLLVVSFQHKGKNYKYRAFPLKSLEDQPLAANQWNKLTFEYLTPEVRSKKDQLVVYLWNRGSEESYFDDLTIEALEEQ